MDDSFFGAGNCMYGFFRGCGGEMKGGVFEVGERGCVMGKAVGGGRGGFIVRLSVGYCS